VLLHAIEHDLATIGRDVEVPDDETAGKIGELVFRASLRIDEPVCFTH